MGFGLLFIGYFFLIFYPLDSLGVMPNLALLGCFFMFGALKRLISFCPGNKSFKAARGALIAFFSLSVACLALNVAELGGELSPKLELYFAQPLSILSKLAVSVFSVLLFVGVHKLSLEVELPKLAHGALRRITVVSVYALAMTFSGVFLILFTAGVISGETIAAIIFYTGYFAFLLEYFCIFFNLALIFSCYAHICLEGDEEMPYREDIFDKIVAYTKRNKK